MNATQDKKAADYLTALESARSNYKAAIENLREEILHKILEKALILRSIDKSKDVDIYLSSDSFSIRIDSKYIPSSLGRIFLTEDKELIDALGELEAAIANAKGASKKC